MGFYSTEPAFSRGVGNGKRAVGFFSADHRRNAPSRPAKALAKQGLSAVVSRTSAPDAPLYGYRYYRPKLGRWVNRDPILNELPVPNILKQLLKRYEIDREGLDYAFVENNPCDLVDYLGLCLIFYNCTLESQSPKGLCDKTCNYECKEIVKKRRNLGWGTGTPCWEVPEPYDFTTTLVARGIRFFSICCWKGKCKESFEGSHNIGGATGTLDCSKSDCLNDCDKSYTAAKLACMLIPPPTKYACKTAAIAAKKLCDLGCSLCKNP